MSNSTSPFELHLSWEEALRDEWQKPYIAQLNAFYRHEYQSRKNIYPPIDLIFNALNQTPYDRVRVVIIGQDPYHGPGQAHGLAFSVPHGIAVPPSLKNIYKELQSDLGIPPREHGCLESWAKQGVLLLNATLTVREGDPLSHQGKGWEQFTDAVVETLGERKEPLIFLLWGKSAEKKCQVLKDKSQHILLTAPHPSPLSAYHGFFGCKHFSKVNQILQKRGEHPIDWNL